MPTLSKVRLASCQHVSDKRPSRNGQSGAVLGFSKKLKGLFNKRMPHIALIGYGVVGRALGEVLAARVRGAKVVANDPKLRPGRAGKVRIEKNLPKAVAGADWIFLCVPSHLQSHGVAGPGWRKLAAQLRLHAKAEAILVIKSTLVPGDVAELEKLTRRRVVVCPEFMSEGTAERDILHPHRVLIGGSDPAAVESVIRLYRQWVPARKIIRMDAWSAQLAKLLANAMLAQRVSSINSMTALCERAGGDVRSVAKAVGLDPRIGPHFLNASPGFGGSCLEKDIRLLCGLARSLGHPEVARYWQAVIDSNDAHVGRCIRKIVKLTGPKGRIAVLGLSFKAGVSDSRNSMPLRIAQALKAKGHRVIGHDPMMKRVPGLEVLDSIYEAASGAQCIVLMSDAKEYRNIDWIRLRRLSPLAKIVEAAGVKVPSVFGRGTVHRLGGLS
jgi:UDPglucose 6-dehydrogenase